MTRTTRAAAAALAVVLAAAVALADRETAKFHAGRADKAVAGKKWDEAAELYRKALEEDETYLVARYGLAQSLIGAGNTARGVEELRAFVDAARALAPFPPEWKATLAKAEKQLNDLDAAGAALTKIADQYVDDLLGLAERWTTKDPALAERSLRRVLELRPGHAKATQILEKMGKNPAGAPVELFDGRSVRGWEAADPPMWQVINGEFVGECHDSAYGVRTLKSYSGNFDVRLEAKLIEGYDGPVMFALLACCKPNEDRYEFGPIRGKVYFADTTGPNVSRDVSTRTPPEMKTKPFDLKQWTQFELQFRAGEVTALINGEAIGTDVRPARRDGGFIGLKVQNSRVAFRNIQVEMR